MDPAEEDTRPTVCGLPLVDVPEGITPLSAVIVLKALDEDGDPAYFTAATESLLTVEAEGMLRFAVCKIEGGWIRGEGP